MKALLLVAGILCFSTAFAGTVETLNSGKFKIEDVKSSSWLERIEAKLDTEYDFNEHMSYAYEDHDEIVEYCHFINDSEITDVDLVWKKATYKKAGKKRTLAYVLVMYTYAESSDDEGDLVSCEFPRDVFVVDRSGKNITNKIDFDMKSKL